MGRCQYNLRPNFYYFCPFTSDIDQIAGTNYVGGVVPIWGNNGAIANLRRTQAFLGAELSAGNVVEAGANSSVHAQVHSGVSNVAMSSAAARIDDPSGADWTGTIRWAGSTADETAGTATEGFMDVSRNEVSTDETYYRLDGIVAAAEEFDGLDGVAVISHGSGWNGFDGGYGGSAAADLSAIIPDITHDTGPVHGGMTIYPIPHVPSMAADGVVRRIRVPMDMRILSVVFSHGGFTGGGTPDLRLRNNTTGLNITDLVPMATATPANPDNELLTVDPTTTPGFTDQGSARDLSAGDEIEINLTDVVTTAVNIHAWLVVATRSHFNEGNFLRDYHALGALQAFPTSNPKSWGEHHSSVSGPALGGLACIPFGPFDKAGNTAEELLYRVTMPFAGEALGFYLGNRNNPVVPPGEPSMRLNNSTQAVDLFTTLDFYISFGYTYTTSGLGIADWNGAGGNTMTNRTLARGDVLDLYGTTDAHVSVPAFDQAYGGLIVRTTGFLDYSPRLD